MVWVQKPMGARITDALKAAYGAYQGGKRAGAARELLAANPDFKGLENFIDPLTGEFAGVGKDLFNYTGILKRQEIQNEALLDRIDYQAGLRRQMRGEERAYQEAKDSWKERKAGVKDILESLDDTMKHQVKYDRKGKKIVDDVVLDKEGLGSKYYGIPGQALSLDLKQRLANRIYDSEPTTLFGMGSNNNEGYGILEESGFSPYKGQSLIPMY